MIHADPPARPEAVFFPSTRQPPVQTAGLHRSPGLPRVLACIDDEATGQVVSSHAAAVGRSLGLPVTFARVLDTPERYDIPADPVEWLVKRRRGRQRLEQLSRQAGATNEVGNVLLAGEPSEELNRWAEDHDVSLAVLGTRNRGDSAGRRGLGSTARSILSRAVSSLLLVPPSARIGDEGYHRLLVPLDGSTRAESVIPVAARIARAKHAEILLVHVVPQLETVQPGFVDPATRALRDKLDQRNRDNAQAYLDELRHRIIGGDIAARTIIVREGDAREQLRRLALAEGVDLIVLSSHGATGLADVPCGSVTEYLANHAPAPLLIIRPEFGVGIQPVVPKSAGQLEAAPN